MGRGAVQVEIYFLNIFAMIALRACQTKQPLLEYGIPAIPQSQGKAHAPLIVADTRQAILVPAIGARARRVMGEIIPGTAIGAIILTYRAPGAFTQVGTPALPGIALKRQALHMLATLFAVDTRKFHYLSSWYTGDGHAEPPNFTDCVREDHFFIVS